MKESMDQKHQQLSKFAIECLYAVEYERGYIGHARPNQSFNCRYFSSHKDSIAEYDFYDKVTLQYQHSLYKPNTDDMQLLYDLKNYHNMLSATYQSLIRASTVLQVYTGIDRYDISLKELGIDIDQFPENYYM